VPLWKSPQRRASRPPTKFPHYYPLNEVRVTIMGNNSPIVFSPSPTLKVEKLRPASGSPEWKDLSVGDDDKIVLGPEQIGFEYVWKVALFLAGEYKLSISLPTPYVAIGNIDIHVAGCKKKIGLLQPLSTSQLTIFIQKKYSTFPRETSTFQTMLTWLTL
jgi:hypothetical protein